jgi:hypothetical protein
VNSPAVWQPDFTAVAHRRADEVKSVAELVGAVAAAALVGIAVISAIFGAGGVGGGDRK